MNIFDPLIRTDETEQQLFTGYIHNSKLFIGPNDNTGIFFDENNIIISAGSTAIHIGNGEIYIGGKLIQRDLIENTSRGYITNPLGMLPGTIIPITIPATFNKFPDPFMFLPFISMATQLLEFTIAMT